MCLIRWFLDMKQGQGKEVGSYSLKVWHDNADIRNRIFVIFKRKKCPTETWRESVGHPVNQHQHTEGEVPAQSVLKFQYRYLVSNYSVTASISHYRCPISTDLCHHGILSHCQENLPDTLSTQTHHGLN